MDYRKILGIITVFVVVMIALMLSSSYAWYSFNGASTTFDAVTNNDDITVTYHTGRYINTSIAVPISSGDIERYSEKSSFSIDVNNALLEDEIVVAISLVDVEIADELKNSNFRYDLLLDGESVSGASGNFSGISGDTFTITQAVVLDALNTNDFELRIYILDDGTNQNTMMNKTFKGTISINVISRLRTNLDQSGADILVSSITIDGEESSYLPVSGYYDMTATCSKGSSLTWEPLSKTITYAKGSYVNDSCSLVFTSSTNYPVLASIAEPGDYVDYTGNNGCEGKHCQGYNANYVSDTDMGYCNNSNYKFTENGWRVGYIEDGTAYLISGGAPECYGTSIESISSSTSSTTLSTNYYYGTGYYLNPHTGYFELTGVTSSTLAWSSNYNDIINNTPYTCISSTKPVSGTKTGACTTLYKIDSYSSDTAGLAYKITMTNESTGGVPVHLNNLNNEALLYCNKDFSYGGVCDSSSSWAMNASDFEKITGSALSSSSCYGKYSNMSCGYNNSLIDNGGYYWYATAYSSSSDNTFDWNPDDRYVNSYNSNSANGVRPVLRLESLVYVTGGSGTYEDPYQIGNS